MSYCPICHERKPDHCVLHAPQRLPERGERVALHTACLDCTTGLANTAMSVDTNTCAHSFLEQVRNGVFEARFSARAPGRRDDGETLDYCHQHGAPTPQDHSREDTQTSRLAASAFAVQSQQRRAVYDLMNFGMEAQTDIAAVTRYSQNTVNQATRGLSILRQMTGDEAQFQERVSQRNQELETSSDNPPPPSFLNW